ncbi:MAG TPA: hypothetical protein VGD05_11685 [Pyrinomonadaceae bacterium]|jgi:hypothetical protein
MKNSKLILFFLILFSFVSFAQAQKSNKLDTFGYYYIQNPSKNFKDISEIHLSGDYGSTLKPPIFGLIRLKNKKATDFHLLKPFQKGKYISFSTKSVGGISYQFSGGFTKLYDKVVETRPGTTPQVIVLRGNLIKLKGKRKIAGQSVGFIYFAGD